MNDNNQIIIYQTEDGQTQVDVRMENDTVWLTQAQMAELFGKDQSVIARHIANVFKEGELEKESNMQILHNTLSKYKPTAIYDPQCLQRGQRPLPQHPRMLDFRGDELYTLLKAPIASRNVFRLF